MKKLLEMHRDSAVLMLLSAGVCVLSGRQKDMRTHRAAAALLCLGGAVCLATGFRMTHPKKTVGTEKPAPAADESREEEPVTEG